MIRNGYLGLALVFILLAVFLEARLAFWVSLGIPISILGSFIFLPFMNVSINLITMFAFIITLGIVVDDAIVVGENIYYHRQSGLDWFDAARAGRPGNRDAHYLQRADQHGGLYADDVYSRLYGQNL